MALLNIFRGTQAEVSERPVSDGALLFATDTKKIYLDKDSSRIEMSSVQDLSDYVTTSELEGLLATKADATHTHADATNDASGFMSVADKTKLDGLVGVPAGGTDGQVLTKTAEGEEWADAPETDLSGYLSIDENNILQTTESGTIEPTYFKVCTTTDSMYTQVGSGAVVVSANGGQSKLEALGTSNGAYARLVTNYNESAKIETNGQLGIGSKYVSGITDAITESPVGLLLATDKAVKDYVDENAGSSIDLPLPVSQGGTGVTTEDALIQLIFNSASTPQASDTQYGVVKFASDEDFKAYMGIS